MRSRINDTLVLWNSTSTCSRPDQPTRERVARSILVNGPSTAAALAERLDLTPAAVRRHLDHLLDDGTVEAREPRLQPAAAAAARPRSSRSPRPAATVRPAVRRPRRPGAALPRRDRRRRRRSREFAAPPGRRASRSAIDAIVAGRRPSSTPAEALAQVLHRRGLRRLGARQCRSASSCASSTARSPTSPTSSRSCARPRPRRSARSSAATSSGWPPSPTATGSAPPASRTPPRRHQTHPTATDQERSLDDHHRRAQPRARRASAATSSAGPTRDAAGADRPARPQRGRRPRHLREEERAAVDARPAPEGPQALRPQAHADLGLRPRRASTSTTSSTSSAPPRSRPPRGRTCPRTSRTPTTSSASPRRRSSASSPASPRSTSPRSSTTQIREDLEEQGVIFLDTDTALREHPELFQEYFGTVIPVGDNKFAALNTSVWSGGSFIYVPKGVHVDIPLQAYFRINTENMGQFERTLIIVDEDAYVHYVEGCTAPIYSSRLAALRGRRDHREEGRPLPLHDHPELVEQRLQPRHQARHLRGRRDHGVGRRQHRLQGDDEVPRRLPDGRARQGRDAVDRVRRRGPAPGRRRQDGARRAAHLELDHLASRWRAAAAVRRTAGWSRSTRAPTTRKSNVLCDALLVDQISRSDTYPYVDIREDDVSMGHEATRLQGLRRPALLPDEPRHGARTRRWR